MQTEKQNNSARAARQKQRYREISKALKSSDLNIKNEMILALLKEKETDSYINVHIENKILKAEEQTIREAYLENGLLMKNNETPDKGIHYILEALILSLDYLPVTTDKNIFFLIDLLRKVKQQKTVKKMEDTLLKELGFKANGRRNKDINILEIGEEIITLKKHKKTMSEIKYILSEKYDVSERSIDNYYSKFKDLSIKNICIFYESLGVTINIEDIQNENIIGVQSLETILNNLDHHSMRLSRILNISTRKKIDNLRKSALN